MRALLKVSAQRSGRLEKVQSQLNELLGVSARTLELCARF
jgi:hypothetical protein